MKRIVKIVGGLLLASFLLVGCYHDDPQSSPTGPSDPPPSYKPIRRDTITE